MLGLSEKGNKRLEKAFGVIFCNVWFVFKTATTPWHLITKRFWRCFFCSGTACCSSFYLGQIPFLLQWSSKFSACLKKFHIFAEQPHTTKLFIQEFSVSVLRATWHLLSENRTIFFAPVISSESLCLYHQAKIASRQPVFFLFWTTISCRQGNQEQNRHFAQNSQRREVRGWEVPGSVMVSPIFWVSVWSWMSLWPELCSSACPLFPILELEEHLVICD